MSEAVREIVVKVSPATVFPYLVDPNPLSARSTDSVALRAATTR